MTVNRNKKAILVGDYKQAVYHPLKGPDTELKAILSDYEVTFSEDYNMFLEENLKQYDLCVSFTDRWQDKLTDAQTSGILSHVCNGGGILLIHNGISIQTRYKLAQMIGGKFDKHPDQEVLPYKPTKSGHIIMDGIEGFSSMEEPYQFILDNLVETTLLLEYEYDGKTWPAAWAHTYGLGRVVFLSPGHNIETFHQPMFRKMILRSALWASGLL